MEKLFKELQDLFDTVASGHSFSQVNYRLCTPEEYAEMLPKMETKNELWRKEVALNPENGHVEMVGKAKFLSGLGNALLASWRFTETFSSFVPDSLIPQVKQIINQIVNLAALSFDHVEEFEEVYLDAGGYERREFMFEDEDGIHLFTTLDIID